MSAPVRTTLPISDGTLSALEWPAGKTLLHFAHATGFNAPTYRSLLAPLAERFHIVAIDQRGHGCSKLPTTGKSPKDWLIYRDDLLQVLERLGDEPAILAGHSMGGIVSLMVAVLKPQSVSGLVLVEPVLLPGFARYLRDIARLIGAGFDADLAGRAARRRDRFASPEAALAAYTGRGAFKTWPTQTIADYLEGGLVREGGEYRLSCRPDWEAETFRGAPFGMACLARQVKCPVTLVYGTKGSSCPRSQARFFARSGARIVRIDGASHFLPMEFPDVVRSEIARFADAR